MKKIIVGIFVLSSALSFSNVRDDAILELENNNRQLDRDFNIQENLEKQQQMK